MLPTGTALRVLEDQWRERVERAYREYQRALNCLKAVAREDVDSRFTANQVASRALHHYMRDLGVFTDLVLRRQMPPED